MTHHHLDALLTAAKRLHLKVESVIDRSPRTNGGMVWRVSDRNEYVVARGRTAEHALKLVLEWAARRGAA